MNPRMNDELQLGWDILSELRQKSNTYTPLWLQNPQFGSARLLWVQLGECAPVFPILPYLYKNKIQPVVLDLFLHLRAEGAAHQSSLDSSTHDGTEWLV